MLFLSNARYEAVDDLIDRVRRAELGIVCPRNLAGSAFACEVRVRPADFPAVAIQRGCNQWLVTVAVHRGCAPWLRT